MRDQMSLGAIAASVFMAAVMATNAPVAAQGLIFDWGGEKTASSGKQTMKFNGNAKPGEIIVSFGDRKLYYIAAPGIAETYPIAIPRDQSRWEGVTSVSQKRENPSWTPTPDMIAENPRLPRWVPGGHPMNPLGIRALYLGSSYYRIHGTDAPWTIGTAASKGCVRMFNNDVVDLYPKVKVGTKVTVTWQKFDGKTLAFAEGERPAKPAEKAESQPAKPEQSSKAARPQLASYEADEPNIPQVRSKYRKRADGDDAAAPEKPAEKSPSEKALPEKSAADSSDAAAQGKRKARPVAELFDATVDLPDEKKKPVTVAAPAEQAPAKRPAADGERKSRERAAAKVETGSVNAPSSSGPVSNGSAATATTALQVAEKAVAAAERAAQAAERAAAAAERAVAASQKSADAVKDAVQR